MPCRGFMFVNRTFVFITAQKRLQYIASVATLQRIDERLNFSRVRSKSANHFFFSISWKPYEDRVTIIIALADAVVKKRFFVLIFTAI